MPRERIMTRQYKQNKGITPFTIHNKNRDHLSPDQMLNILKKYHLIFTNITKYQSLSSSQLQQFKKLGKQLSRYLEPYESTLKSANFSAHNTATSSLLSSQQIKNSDNKRNYCQLIKSQFIREAPSEGKSVLIEGQSMNLNRKKDGMRARFTIEQQEQQGVQPQMTSIFFQQSPPPLKKCYHKHEFFNSYQPMNGYKFSKNRFQSKQLQIYKQQLQQCHKRLKQLQVLCFNQQKMNRNQEKYRLKEIERVLLDQRYTKLSKKYKNQKNTKQISKVSIGIQSTLQQKIVVQKNQQKQKKSFSGNNHYTELLLQKIQRLQSQNSQFRLQMNRKQQQFRQKQQWYKIQIAKLLAKQKQYQKNNEQMQKQMLRRSKVFNKIQLGQSKYISGNKQNQISMQKQLCLGQIDFYRMLLLQGTAIQNLMC